MWYLLPWNDFQWRIKRLDHLFRYRCNCSLFGWVDNLAVADVGGSTDSSAAVVAVDIAVAAALDSTNIAAAAPLLFAAAYCCGE